jgi:hypothetical protein
MAVPSASLRCRILAASGKKVRSWQRQTTSLKLELLAQKLFGRFIWFDTGGWNQNWKCVKDDHVSKKRVKKTPKASSASADSDAVESAATTSETGEAAKTVKILSHPSDVVFYYDEPYRLIRTYVNTDLKSYKKGSITSTAIASAIESLALTLECAELSEEWREKFVHDEKSYEIAGLLFIYNHDGEYDKDFDQVLAKVNHEKLKIPKDSKIFIFGPSHIRWLDNIRHDLSGLYSEHLLPHEDQWSFYYPDLVRKKKIQASGRAATLEMLSDPYIILSYPSFESRPPGYVVYYRGSGKRAEEFLYLLDHLTHYQMVKSSIDIRIRMLDADENAPAKFSRAIDEFIENFDGEDSDLAKLLRAIKFDIMPQVSSQFSQTKIGMKRG